MIVRLNYRYTNIYLLLNRYCIHYINTFLHGMDDDDMLSLIPSVYVYVYILFCFITYNFELVFVELTRIPELKMYCDIWNAFSQQPNFFN